MATSIVSAPLVVKITETISLNGKQHGGTITKTISGITFPVLQNEGNHQICYH